MRITLNTIIRSPSKMSTAFYDHFTPFYDIKLDFILLNVLLFSMKCLRSEYFMHFFTIFTEHSVCLPRLLVYNFNRSVCEYESESINNYTSKFANEAP